MTMMKRVVRLSLPAGHEISAFHPTDEYVRITSGEFLVAKMHQCRSRASPRSRASAARGPSQ